MDFSFTPEQDDAAALARAGYTALLVGESVVTAADRSGAVAALRTARSTTGWRE